MKKVLVAGSIAFVSILSVCMLTLASDEDSNEILVQNLEALTNGELLPGSGSSYCTASKSDKCIYSTPNGAKGSWSDYRSK